MHYIGLISKQNCKHTVVSGRHSYWYMTYDWWFAIYKLIKTYNLILNKKGSLQLIIQGMTILHQVWLRISINYII